MTITLTAPNGARITATPDALADHYRGDDAMQTAAPTTPDPVGLTIEQIGKRYGITAGPVYRCANAGLILKLGTDGSRNRVYSHADLIECFRSGDLGMPRNAPGRDAHRVQRWRSAIEAAVTTYRRPQDAPALEADGGGAQDQPEAPAAQQEAARTLPEGDLGAALARLAGMASMLADERERTLLVEQVDVVAALAGEAP